MNEIRKYTLGLLTLSLPFLGGCGGPELTEQELGRIHSTVPKLPGDNIQIPFPRPVANLPSGPDGSTRPATQPTAGTTPAAQGTAAKHALAQGTAIAQGTAKTTPITQATGVTLPAAQGTSARGERGA